MNYKFTNLCDVSKMYKNNNIPFMQYSAFLYALTYIFDKISKKYIDPFYIKRYNNI